MIPFNMKSMYYDKVNPKESKEILFYKVPDNHILHLKKIKIDWYPKTVIDLYLDSFQYRFEGIVDEDVDLKVYNIVKVVITNESDEERYYSAMLRGYLEKWQEK